MPFGSRFDQTAQDKQVTQTRCGMHDNTLTLDIQHVKQAERNTAQLRYTLLYQIVIIDIEHHTFNSKDN